MSIKVTETIERDCCQVGDLRIYYGRKVEDIPGHMIRFCGHCGQMWAMHRGDGCMEAQLTELVIVKTKFD